MLSPSGQDQTSRSAHKFSQGFSPASVKSTFACANIQNSVQLQSVSCLNKVRSWGLFQSHPCIEMELSWYQISGDVYLPNAAGTCSSMQLGYVQIGKKFTSQPDGEWLDNLYQMLKSWLYLLSSSAAWQLQLTGNATQNGTVGQHCLKLSQTLV